MEARIKALEKAPIQKDLIELLQELLTEGSINEVTRLRPFELANRWDADRYEVLRLMLHATKTGLVDLNWEILCPHCKAPTGGGPRLSDVKSKAICQTCEISFDVDLANSVEAVFGVNQAVRKAKRDVYCIGGPANSPRIMAQFRLKGAETRVASLATSPGLLFVRSYQSTGIVPLESAVTGSEALTVTCGPLLAVSSARLAASGAAVTLVNALPDENLLVFEHETWRSSAATAAIVTTIQEFRDLFPLEAVAPGQEISVGRLTVLFTDLSGSTALYENVGDVKAFDFVQSHFQYLGRLVARHRGGLVKTMGDAIMASFNSPSDALSAALSMQEDWEAFMTKYRLPNEVRLKVGLHEGPAVAFNNQGAQDYFGTTVNMAARIQAQAGGGEVVISRALLDDTEIAPILSGLPRPVEPFEVRLKGIAETQTLYRLHPTVKHI